MQDTSFSKPPSTLPIGEDAPSLLGRVATAWPPDQWRDVHVLLAVSGGADSVALFRAMLELKREHGGSGRLQVAHLNHGLRGREADNDQRWVGDLCRRFDVPFSTDRVAIADEDSREGWEAAARAARYEFLTRTAQQIGARFVATAHTADDQVETVLHRMLRGTGIDGLTGIPELRPLAPSVTLVRPMLTLRRIEVLNYLNALGQGFRTDTSNSNSRFTRNWIRNELLPAIRGRLNPDVEGALLRLSQQASELQEYIAPLVDGLFAQHAASALHGINAGSGEIRISRPHPMEVPLLVLRELCKRAWQQAGWPLRDMGYDQWHQLAEMLCSGAGAPIMLPGGARAELMDGFLVLRRADPR